MARAPAALRLVADRAGRALAAAAAPQAGDGVVVAVSGGADSLALLHALRTLAGPRRWRLEVVTVDHGLRPDAAADAAFVADHAKTLGLATQLLTLDAAELERHRGAGPRACCEAVGVAWREDPSNADEELLRNAVRRRVLPLLEALRPGAARTLARHAALAAEERDWLAPLTAAALAEVVVEGERPQHPRQVGVALRAAQLAALPDALGRRVVRAAAARTAFPVPGADVTDQVLALARSSQPQAGPVAWPGGTAIRDGALVVISPADTRDRGTNR